MSKRVMSPVPIPVPTELDEALSPAWLTAVLAMRFPAIRVRRTTPGPVVSRVSTNARVTIECEGGMPIGLPAELCVKGYFGAEGWAARQAGIPEVCFYRDVFPTADVRSLDCFYAQVDDATGHGVLVTADVVAQGGAFLDALSSYSVDQVAASLAQLASLHASAWCNPKWRDVAWLAPHMAQTLRARGVKEIRHNFEGPIGAGVPKDVRDAEELVAAYRMLAADVGAAQPWTVMHGDPHIGNVFLDSEGRPCFLDWQLAQRGAWYVDVGYHIASALAVDDRRRNERDLLRLYLEQLQSAGVSPPDWDDAWKQMGRGIVHGFFLWGITQKVEPAITAIVLERLGTAVSDHGSLTLSST